MAEWAARSLEKQHATAHRLRSLGWFLIAGIYAVFSRQFAAHAAEVLPAGPFFPLAERFLLVAFLLVGFAGMGVLGQRQRTPMASMGLVRRSGFAQEWALGGALGWSGIVACVLPIALTGGLLVRIGNHDMAAVGALCINLLTLLLATLADELIFRGYPFQRLIAVTGPALATVLMTLLFAFARSSFFGSSPGSLLVTLLLGFLLSMAYLRTRALWLGWGFHFAWNASMALVFGLPISGLTSFSPVFTTYTSGPAWLTGGGYGLEGSAVAVFILLALLFVTAKVTRNLRHRWALPEIVGAGIPVDIDAIAKRQHEEGMGPGAAMPPAAGSQLVQILPVAQAPPHLPEDPRAPHA